MVLICCQRLPLQTHFIYLTLYWPHFRISSAAIQQHIWMMYTIVGISIAYILFEVCHHPRMWPGWREGWLKCSKPEQRWNYIVYSCHARKEKKIVIESSLQFSWVEQSEMTWMTERSLKAVMDTIVQIWPSINIAFQHLEFVTHSHTTKATGATHFLNRPALYKKRISFSLFFPILFFSVSLFWAQPNRL